MVEKGERAQRRLGLLTLAMLTAAALGCNAGAAQSSAPVAGGQAAPANVQGEVASGGGDSAGQTSNAASGGGGGTFGLAGAQAGNDVSVEIDFGAGGAGGCEDPCGFCDENGYADPNIYQPVTSPQVLYTYQYEDQEYLSLPFAETTVCACGFPDENVQTTSIDPSDQETVLQSQVTFRPEADSYCATTAFDFSPGTVPGPYLVSYYHQVGTAETEIAVLPPDRPTARWYYPDQAWFAGFQPNEPVEVYFWTIDDPDVYPSTARFLGTSSGSADDVGEVIVDTQVGGTEATLIGVLAASGEALGCRDGYDNVCLGLSDVPLADIVFLRANP